MNQKFISELSIAIERGWAKEALCTEHDSGNWLANTHTGTLQAAPKTLKTPEIFRAVIVRLPE